MPTHSTLNPDVQGAFEVTLARGLNMTRERLPIQTAISKHKRKFFSLAGHRRQDLAAALQWEYRRRSARLCDDEGALQVLNEQYSNAQYFVTPIHRLPAEILMEIFRIVFDINPSPIRVVLVCRRWYRVVEAMVGLQLSLELGTWTDPEMVQRAVGGMARRLLNITVHTDQDFDFGASISEPYSALATAAENASDWRSLTVHSLPRGGQLSDRSLHTLITSMDVSPMSRLEEVKLTSELEPSPLVDRLLQKIGATTMGSLVKMETNSLHAIRFLVQTTSTYTFRSLTTFRAVVQKMDEPIDLLPHFSTLEVLEVTNLLLPSYQDDTPLPFVQNLRSLYLKTVSIEWMAGRVFPLLGVCTIATPPRPFLALDVHLLTCREFHFHHRCTTSFGRFRMPMVSLLEINSNQWSPLQGNESLVLMCMAGLGTVVQPSVLHLTMLCNGPVLLSALRLLPNLRELSLGLPRPSALGRCFFTALLAQPAITPPSTSIGSNSLTPQWFNWAGKENGWYTAICPSLRVVKLWYQRWLRPSEQIGMVAPLLALSWTRQKTATPLSKLCVHMRANSGDWNSVDLVPVKPHCIIDLNIPHLQTLKLDDEDRRAIFEMNLTSAALSVIEGPTSRSRYITEALFGPSFHGLRVLLVQGEGEGKIPLNVLHCFHHLEELLLQNVQVSHCHHNVDLPLCQTLKILAIRGGCVRWLDGLKFLLLTSFTVNVGDEWHNSFPQRVDMPVCTYIHFFGWSLESLPMFRAGIVAPLLYEWDMQYVALNQKYFRNGKKNAAVEALEQIHVPVLRLAIREYYQGLVAIITPRHELEELTIQISGSYRAANGLLCALMETTDATLSTVTHDGHVTTTGICSGTETKVICSNLKELGLQFYSVPPQNREEVRQWCIQTMERRKQAGSPLRRCCIWLGNDRYKDPWLVLTTSNDGMIENA